LLLFIYLFIYSFIIIKQTTRKSERLSNIPNTHTSSTKYKNATINRQHADAWKTLAVIKILEQSKEQTAIVPNNKPDGYYKSR